MNANNHLNDEQLIGYIFQTLDDAQRETFDRHLHECPDCRVKISATEQRQHQIENDLKAEINGKSPPAGMSFAQIAPNLNRHRNLWQHFTASAPLAAAALGLVLTLIGVWQTLIESYPIQLHQRTQFSGSLPTLACFFFMFVSMDQFDRSFSIRPRFIVSVILSIILWLGNFLLGLLNIIVIRDLTLAAYIFSGGSPEGARVFAILAVFLAAIVLIGVIIGGAEFHFRHLGHPSSWKLFIWTIVIQLLVLVLPYFIL